MKVKLSVKVPAGAGSVFSGKAASAVRRALSGPARDRIAAVVRDRVAAVADKDAPGIAGRYRAALRSRAAVDVTGKAVVITVDDPLVVASERGAASFDMKAKLLARGKPAKGGGVYVDVPLRHEAGSVPQAIRTAARRAARSIGGVGSIRVAATTPGRSFTRILNRGPVAQALGAGPRAQQVAHKRGIHDDIIRRSRRGPGGGISARYTTIRRLSSRSPAEAWVHPGFKARHIIRAALLASRSEVAAIIREEVSRYGRK